MSQMQALIESWRVSEIIQKAQQARIERLEKALREIQKSIVLGRWCQRDGCPCCEAAYESAKKIAREALEEK